ncbi:Vacuolar protein sorting protein DigA [Taphrina deformans PYCC 5710]|uniref:Vacuolar protein sorting protein DigA n=1 Tax=Taphrina deformans (strain PYCC 5710 / ATCC 11124 / CBS 356.35 / IMI 108563 / JCM 9778 / NBRC 8474) TaxID=1097556 RepID=R4XB30_TAPDE|nr:Vacuolar protein sorting protein DigA [Taphrina deformans PYCC 5710]|eukprot:CCG83079.1 Vacuolar protein sorting protein DigA [Taphrina deformans PYCC 5710]
MSLLDDYVNGSQSKPKANGLHNAPDNSGLAMFKVDQVTLPGSLDIVSAAVQNNVLYIAVVKRKLLRIDLASPAEIQDFEIPKSKGNEGDEIRKIFLDITGQHLVVSATKGENWYIHSKLSKPAKLKLRGLVECVAWNTNGTSFATKEVLFGLVGGTVVETWLEPTEGFNKTVERYTKQVYTTSSNESVTGIQSYTGTTARDRHILLATHRSLRHFSGVMNASTGENPSMTSIFSATSSEQSFQESKLQAPLDMVRDNSVISASHYAWLSSSGIFHGPAPISPPGDSSFQDANLVALSYANDDNELRSQDLKLSAFHIITIQNECLSAFNRFDGSLVFRDQLATRDNVIALMADTKEDTYWMYTRTELYEIVITDESQNMWAIFLKQKDYDAALKYTNKPAHTDLIYGAQAQSLMDKQLYVEAAEIFGRTTLPLEQVALRFLDLNERDALRTYLVKKLEGQKKSAEMQRTTLATWVLELFMSRLSTLDDMHNNLRDPEQGALDRRTIKAEYSIFISKHKADLDKDATYALINSHGRSEELLVYANAINDYEYIVHHHIHQDNFSAALDLLVQHPSIELTYATSTILLPEIPNETVEMWMRMTQLDAALLLPAILMYNDRKVVPIHENQAIRYLNFAIKHQSNTDPAVHNALIGIYARDCAGQENSLLEFLEAQTTRPYYDLDFALRQCKQYDRVMSCVHIYSSMGLYDQAVQWALQHDNIELASTVADRVEDNPALRKKLWLMIAKKTIEQDDGTKAAIELTKKSDVLRIEDLVPHLGEFTVIDDFKDEICEALENYTTNIEALRQEMDDSSKTADDIEKNIQDLRKRFAVIHVGEQCYSCSLPLMDQQFYVFPCQHTFHSQCLKLTTLKEAAPHIKRRVAQLQGQLDEANAALNRGSNGDSISKNKENDGETGAKDILRRKAQKLAEELDSIIAEECLLCGHIMIRSISSGFLPEDDKKEIAAADSWKL